jgi:hypothetical protein
MILDDVHTTAILAGPAYPIGTRVGQPIIDGKQTSEGQGVSFVVPFPELDGWDPSTLERDK